MIEERKISEEITQEDIQELNSKLPAYEVLKLIGYRLDTVLVDGERIISCCPLDKVDDNGMFSINKRTNMFSCRKCYKKGNLIKLFSLVKRIPLEKAFWELKHHFGIHLKRDQKKEEENPFAGTGFERYNILKQEIKGIAETKKRNLESKVIRTEDNSVNRKVNNDKKSGVDGAMNGLKFVPGTEKFKFVLMAKNSSFYNMTEMDFNKFKGFPLLETEEFPVELYVNFYFYKSSTVSLFEGLFKQKAIWIWGAPFIIFHSYTPLTYLLPFYSAKYSPFEKILFSGQEISKDEFLKTVKKDNLAQFDFVLHGRKYKFNEKIFPLKEVYFQAKKFLRNLELKFKISSSQLKVLVGEDFFVVFINPYLFGLMPSKYLTEIFDNIARELLSISISGDVIENIDFESVNLNTYHPAFLWRLQPGKDKVIPGDKFLVSTFEERLEIGEANYKGILDFEKVLPKPELEKVVLEIIDNFTPKEFTPKEKQPQVSTVSSAENNTDNLSQNLSQKTESFHQQVELPSRTDDFQKSSLATPSKKMNFVDFFNDSNYFKTTPVIERKKIYFSKPLATGNAILDKYIEGGFKFDYVYVVLSHNYKFLKIFIEKILLKSYLSLSVNFLLTDESFIFGREGILYDNLKLINGEIWEEWKNFKDELESLNFKNVLFIHNLNFIQGKKEFFSSISFPLIIYGNTSQYSEIEKEVFDLKKGIKFMEIVKVDFDSRNLILLVGDSDKLNLEKLELNF